MSNIQKLVQNEDKNVKVFANSILTLMKSQGFYQRLCEGINEFNDEYFGLLLNTLKQQNFNDIVDVVLWLES